KLPVRATHVQVSVPSIPASAARTGLRLLEESVSMAVLPHTLVVTVLLPFLLGAMLGSCAVHPEPVAPWQADLEVVVEHDPQLGSGSVLLKSIPGRLHGIASGPDLYRVSAKRTSIRIPADVLARQVRERAAIL